MVFKFRCTKIFRTLSEKSVGKILVKLNVFLILRGSREAL